MLQYSLVATGGTAPSCTSSRCDLRGWIEQRSVDTYGNMKMQLTCVVHHADQAPCRWRCGEGVRSVAGVDVQAGDAAQGLDGRLKAREHQSLMWRTHSRHWKTTQDICSSPSIAAGGAESLLASDRLTAGLVFGDAGLGPQRASHSDHLSDQQEVSLHLRETPMSLGGKKKTSFVCLFTRRLAYNANSSWR